MSLGHANAMPTSFCPSLPKSSVRARSNELDKPFPLRYNKIDT